MSDDVEIRIKAIDNATATLRAIQSEMSSFMGTAKNLAGFSIAGFGLRELASFAGDSLKAYAESERAVTMLDRVLKSTGNTIKMTRKEIQDYAEARMTQTAFDDDAIVEAASHLARFRDLSGETFTETLEAAQDLATVMGTDLVSATQMLGRALSDPAEGMSKLARAGVLFTESQKKQIEMLDLIGDKAGQQKIVLEELQRQFGGAALADANTASGQIKQLNNAIGELKETIGQELLPTVQQLLSIVKAGAGAVPGAAGQLDNILAGGDKLGSVAQEKQRLQALKEIQAKFAEENKQSLEVMFEMGKNPLNALFSPIRNANAIQTFQLNKARMDDIQKALAEQGGRIERANQAAIPGTIGNAIKSTGLNALLSAASLKDGFSAQLGDKVFRDLFPGIALDIEAAGLAKMLGFNPQQQQKQELERSLQATESRFLTRGRGQLSPEAKKRAEDDAKQLAELKAIRAELAGLGDSILVVQGVS